MLKDIQHSQKTELQGEIDKFTGWQKESVSHLFHATDRSDKSNKGDKDLNIPN